MDGSMINTSIHEGRRAQPGIRPSRSRRTVIATTFQLCMCGAILATTTLIGTATAAADPSPELSSLEKWQLRRLFVPNEREREHERKGNVYIYEGLTDRQVEDAMSRHFDRIEYMLFLGTKRTDQTGEVLRKPDGTAAKESADCGP
jgi:hypothetical protein